MLEAALDKLESPGAHQKFVWSIVGSQTVLLKIAGPGALPLLRAVARCCSTIAATVVGETPLDKSHGKVRYHLIRNNQIKPVVGNTKFRGVLMKISARRKQ